MGEVRRGAQGAMRHLHELRVEGARQGLRVEHGLGGDVERPVDVLHDRQSVSFRDVRGVHRLEPQVRIVRHEADQLRSHRPPRQQRAQKQAPDPRRGFALERQRGAQAHDAHVTVVLLEPIEQALDAGFLSRVERSRDPLTGPGLIPAALLRRGGVDPDRGGVHEGLHSRAPRRVEDPLATLHVGALEFAGLTHRLDPPRQVDDRIGSRQVGRQVVPTDVRGDEAGLVEIHRRHAPSDADDVRHVRIHGQGIQHAGAHVPRCSGYHHTHATSLPDRTDPAPMPRHQDGHARAGKSDLGSPRRPPRPERPDERRLRLPRALSGGRPLLLADVTVGPDPDGSPRGVARHLPSPLPVEHRGRRHPQ